MAAFFSFLSLLAGRGGGFFFGRFFYNLTVSLFLFDETKTLVLSHPVELIVTPPFSLTSLTRLIAYTYDSHIPCTAHNSQLTTSCSAASPRKNESLAPLGMGWCS
ncbi:hypothetical protein EDB81DRAFT_279660 [Dactylonectria macrodidyma]|uniref:Uncharacterized protein n=1 Tax=Dactylonectria macrodidyma TaxID=307937 RepID=A0A9P9FPC3_9HYPO|nr:hypothetical protein EDB81DRAFT_279660 [Dactylonectria macrodidyma]